MEQITITKSELENLRLMYKKAVETGKEVFLFQGKELLTSYAKYLIEYLDSRFKQ